MIIEVNEKYDVSPEWFEKEAIRDPRLAWEERLCELLTVYKVKDEAGAVKAAEKMKAAGMNAELISKAME